MKLETQNSWIPFYVGMLLIFAFALVAAASMEVNWDEGWAFCTARTWIERQHFGCLIEGRLTSPRHTQSVFSTWLVKLGFSFWGIEILPGRIFTVCCTLLATLLLSTLAKVLYGVRAAILTPIVIFFSSLISESIRPY